MDCVIKDGRVQKQLFTSKRRYAQIKNLPVPFGFYEVEALKSFREEKKEGANRVEKAVRVFQNDWLKKNGNESYFDFGICKLPDLSNTPEEIETLFYVFNDSFLFPCFFNDNYDKKIVEYFEFYMDPQPKYEGPYGFIQTELLT